MQQDKPKRRIINFRSFVITALCIIIAIFIALVYVNNIPLGFFLLIVFLSLLAIITITLNLKKSEPYKIATFILAIVLSIVAFAGFVIRVNTWEAEDVKGGGIYKVSGRLDSQYLSYGQRILLLSDIKLDDKEYRGRIKIYVEEINNTLQHAQEGDNIEFSAKVRATKLCNGFSVNYKVYRNNIRFDSNVKDSAIKLTSGQPDFIQKIRARVYSALKNNLSENYAAVAYSILTGGRAEIDQDLAKGLSVSGIGHILSVSGLHVGFVSMLLIWILKKLKCKNWLMCVIVTVSLFFYACIAGFSPSVIRASLMSLVSLFTILNGQRRDLFNNLAFSVSAILTVSPVFLFEYGFLLSVCAVLGIVFFSNAIKKILIKARLPRLAAAPVSVTVATQIGAMPVMILFSNTLSTYSIVTNSLVMPVIVLTFMGLFVGTVLTCLFPFMGFIIKFFGLGLKVIDFAASLVADMPFAELLVFSTAAVFLCYILYFFSCRFFIAKRAKPVISAVCLLMSLAIIIAGNISYKPQYEIIPIVNSYYEVTTVFCDDGKVYVIGDFESAAGVRNMLIKAKIRKVDAVFLNKINNDIADEIIKFKDTYKNLTVYCPIDSRSTGMLALIENGINVNYIEYASHSNIDIESGISCIFDRNEGFAGYKYSSAISTVLFFGKSVKYELIPSALLNSADIIRSLDYIGTENGQRFFVNLYVGFPDDLVYIGSSDEYFIYNYKNDTHKILAR